MSYSASASIDTQASKTSGGRARIHDAREYTPGNAEATLAAENRHYQIVEGATDEEAFDRLFMDEIRAYNDKQALKYGRPAKENCQGTVREVIDPKTGETKSMKLGKKALDRMVPEDESGVPRYLEKVRADGRDMTTMEEIVLGIGNRDELGITDAGFDAGQWRAMKERDKQTGGHEAADYVAAHRPPELRAGLEKARAALEKCREDWAEKFPNLRLLRFDIHMDEPDGSPHAHVVYVPVTYANKTGPAMQCSLGGAVREMGYNEGTTRGWDALGSMRQAQRRFVYEHGIEAGLDMTLNKGCEVTKHMNKKQLNDYGKALEKTAGTLASAQQTLDDVRLYQLRANNAVAQAQHGYFPAEDDEGDEARVTITDSPEGDAFGPWLEEMRSFYPVGRVVEQAGSTVTVSGPYVPGVKALAYEATINAAQTAEEAKGDAESLRQQALLDAEMESEYLMHVTRQEARDVEAELAVKREQSAALGREIAARNNTLAELNNKIREKREAVEQFDRETRNKRRNLVNREARIEEAEHENAETAKKNARDAAQNAAREKQLREGIAAVKLAQETVANPTINIAGKDVDEYISRVVERTVLATADVFMRSEHSNAEVRRERMQLGHELHLEAEMAATMGTRMRLDDGSEGTLFTLVRDRVHAFMSEPMGVIARAVSALSDRVRDYLAKAEEALNDKTIGTNKPNTPKQQTTKAAYAAQQHATFAKPYYTDITPSSTDYDEPDF